MDPKGFEGSWGILWVKKDLPIVLKDPGGSLSAINAPDGFLGLWRVLRGLKGSYKHIYQYSEQEKLNARN